jgi:hypothetical protein
MTENRDTDVPVFTGQLEKDADGALWAAVYRDDPSCPHTLLRRERVPSTRAGKRRVQAMVMEQVDLEINQLETQRRTK